MVLPLGLKDLEAVLQDGWQAIELLKEEKLTILCDFLRARIKTGGDFSRWSLRVRRFLKETQAILERQAEDQPASIPPARQA